MQKSSALSDRLTDERENQNQSQSHARTATERQSKFCSVSLEPVNRLYTPDDLSGVSFHDDVGAPGNFPYTRGIHATGYRGKLWTMRQFAGFGTPEETN